jgi:hypothetical protein
MFTDATLRRAKAAVGVVAKRQAGGPNDAKRRKWYCGIGDGWNPPALESAETTETPTPPEGTTPLFPDNLSIYGSESPQVVDGQTPGLDAQTPVELEHLKGESEGMSTYGDGPPIDAQPDHQLAIDAQVKPPSEHLVKPKKNRAKRTGRSIDAQVPRVHANDPDPLTDATAFEALLRRSGWGVPEAIGWVEANASDRYVPERSLKSLTGPQREQLVARLKEVVSAKGGAR